MNNPTLLPPLEHLLFSPMETLDLLFSFGAFAIFLRFGQSMIPTDESNQQHYYYRHCKYRYNPVALQVTADTPEIAINTIAQAKGVSFIFRGTFFKQLRLTGRLPGAGDKNAGSAPNLISLLQHYKPRCRIFGVAACD
jgi:hypothetical protein